MPTGRVYVPPASCRRRLGRANATGSGIGVRVPATDCGRQHVSVPIYEIALIDEPERNGLTQAASSQVVKVLFDNQIRMALAM